MGILSWLKKPTNDDELLALVAEPEPRLMEIRLPAGPVNGFDIDYDAGTGRRKYQSQEWLSRGYDGVRFVGEGVGVTHLQPIGDQTILADRHAGIVRLEGMTIHCGPRQGIWFGLEHRDRPVEPKFALQMRNCNVVSDRDHTTTWGIFGYQADVTLEDVDFDLEYSNEHASYWHGFAKSGLVWRRVRVRASGAEGCKVRSSTSETARVDGAKIWLENCQIRNWYQPHSWRGGGGLVVQGGGCDIVIQRTIFQGGPDLAGPPAIPASQRSRCIMVDDSSGDFFSVAGTDGVYANGHIIVRDCGLSGGPGTDNLSTLLRVGNLAAGTHRVARSFTLKQSAVYGRQTCLQLSHIPSGRTRVTGCNTGAIRELSYGIGIDTRYEAVIPLSSSLLPASAGLSR